ncbi:hypothetical protein TCAL_14206 [Tigriopus californicus]|uniref:Cyclin-dependent kinase 2-associated protein n=1 Tax=Tigriopus californicus TaxID=6832 RepID=A0A553NSR8_TIGCA|nr:cyclin-dependent kinase 2-associated protein 2-like [Tigriopus californicus]TRY68459.1 hypothetical protein TCAL_14206 [Tigriopus californicus]
MFSDSRSKSFIRSTSKGDSKPQSAQSVATSLEDAANSPFRTPLDLGPSSRGSPVSPLDLHAALNSIPKSYGFTHPNVLSSITTPPAVPPPSSKYWEIPPPSFSPNLSRAPSPKNVSGSNGIGALINTNLCPSSTPVISSLSAASASSSQNEAATNTNQTAHLACLTQNSKYSQLLLVLEEMGKDIRPSYAGSKSSAERLKRGIIHARILVRESLLEVERASKQ